MHERRRNVTAGQDAVDTPREQIQISKIKVRPEHRPSNAEAINGIIDGFKRAGQLQPILVRKIDPDGLMLIAGRQRLEAARALGWDRIDARVVPNCSDKDARMIEISENLHRHELTAIERAEQIEEWRQLCKRGGKDAQVAHPVAGGQQPAEKGISATAKELGVSRREVERAEKIASITPEAKAAAVKADIADNQSALLEVAAAPAAEQVRAVAEVRKRNRKQAKRRKESKPKQDCEAAERFAEKLIKLDRELARTLNDILCENHRVVIHHLMLVLLNGLTSSVAQRTNGNDVETSAEAMKAKFAEMAS